MPLSSFAISMMSSIMLEVKLTLFYTIYSFLWIWSGNELSLVTIVTLACIELRGVLSSWQTEASMKWKYFSFALVSSSSLTFVVSIKSMMKETWFLNVIHWVCTLNCHLPISCTISMLALQFHESMNKHSSDYLIKNQDNEICSGHFTSPSDSQISWGLTKQNMSSKSQFL